MKKYPISLQLTVTRNTSIQAIVTSTLLGWTYYHPYHHNRILQRFHNPALLAFNHVLQFKPRVPLHYCRNSPKSLYIAHQRLANKQLHKESHSRLLREIQIHTASWIKAQKKLQTHVLRLPLANPKPQWRQDLHATPNVTPIHLLIGQTEISLQLVAHQYPGSPSAFHYLHPQPLLLRRHHHYLEFPAYSPLLKLGKSITIHTRRHVRHNTELTGQIRKLLVPNHTIEILPYQTINRFNMSKVGW
jgi:hypothetical protein